MAKPRPYQELQELVAEHGGTMKHERHGYEAAAWIVKVGRKRKVFLSNGSGYPEMDKLYVPKPGVTDPTHFSDYSNTLVPGAWEKFMALL
jgi:hypothetical protein